MLCTWFYSAVNDQALTTSVYVCHVVAPIWYHVRKLEHFKVKLITRMVRRVKRGGLGLWSYKAIHGHIISIISVVI